MLKLFRTVLMTTDIELEQDSLAKPEDLAELKEQGVIDLENSDQEDDEAVSYDIFRFVNNYDERTLDAFVFYWYCKTCGKHCDFCCCSFEM